jgi:Na+-transporting methylmalonyl-CoA/oxaloacetate decarboxylase gamma subunit
MIVVVKYLFRIGYSQNDPGAQDLWVRALDTVSSDRLGGSYVIGIDAITANNGWAMAFTGACIVMVGLAILAFVISQLHKIIALTESKGKKPSTSMPEPAPPAVDLSAAQIDILDDLETAARIYSPLTRDLGEVFPMAALYQIFQKENLPHPHITIMALRGAGFLVPVGEGNFSWKNI